MNKKQMETARLTFEMERKNLLLSLTQKDIVVKGKGISGHKCQNGRHDFSYIRAMIEVKVGNTLMERGKKVTPKRLIQAATLAMEKNKETTLSA